MKMNRKQPHHKCIEPDLDILLKNRGTRHKLGPCVQRKLALQKRIDRRFERHQGQQQILAEFAEFEQQGSPVGREVRL
tara:strand:+ start:3453 stop:3686 length:234 start_codon:yes stop_codon:yes gene_type:complete